MSHAATKKNNENEYTIKDISRGFLSDECHTRGTLPRATLPTYGKYLVRIDDKPDYINYNIEVHPQILEKWLYQNRHLWIPKPGHNDNLIFENFKKFSIDRIEYNPKKLFHPLLLPRPYDCELSSIIDGRINSPEAQFYEEESYCQEKDSVSADNLILTSSIQPPFWWREDKVKHDDRKTQNEQKKVQETFVEKRWKPIPNEIRNSKLTCCERKEALLDMGLPFKHEACTFYNTHFPSPKLNLVKHSFSK